MRLTHASKTGVLDRTGHAGRAQFTAEPDVCRVTANYRNRRITDWQSSPSASQDADGAGSSEAMGNHSAAVSQRRQVET